LLYYQKINKIIIIKKRLYLCAIAVLSMLSLFSQEVIIPTIEGKNGYPVFEIRDIPKITIKQL